jgi:ParB/RepB/Spo0J family partition protein
MTDSVALDHSPKINAVEALIAGSRIKPDPRNPRKFFDQAELNDLAESIRLRGLLQRILVRSTDTDEFMIVFGERRWRAFTLAHGADAPMPVLVCELTDEEALLAQIDENDIRADPSETEQADAAVRALEDAGGDRAEAIRRLGWSASKFDRRMALTKLSAAVKTALNERRIKLGHAELLAAVPPENQDKALATILGAGIDVAKTRELLARMTHQLAAAIFDKMECASCAFNSTRQRTLFETAVGDGACTNAACYELKTEQERKAQAKTATENASKKARQALPIEARAAAPDTDEAASEAAGTRSERAAAPDAATATQPAPGIPATDAQSPQASECDVQEEVRQGGPATTAADQAADSQPPSSEALAGKAAAIQRSMRHKARSLRESTWRRALARHLAETPADAQRAIVAAAFAGSLSELSRTTLPSRAAQLVSAGFSKSKPAKQLATVAALDAAALERAQSAIAAAWALDVPDFDWVEANALACKIDIRSAWRIDKAFLDLHTKDELNFLALECGLVDHVGAKPFSKLVNGKRDALIAAMLAAPGFDWSGRLPSSMTLDERYGPPTTTATPAESAPATRRSSWPRGR